MGNKKGGKPKVDKGYRRVMRQVQKYSYGELRIHTLRVARQILSVHFRRLLDDPKAFKAECRCGANMNYAHNFFGMVHSQVRKIIGSPMQYVPTPMKPETVALIAMAGESAIVGGGPPICTSLYKICSDEHCLSTREGGMEIIYRLATLTLVAAMYDLLYARDYGHELPVMLPRLKGNPKVEHVSQIFHDSRDPLSDVKGSHEFVPDDRGLGV